MQLTIGSLEQCDLPDLGVRDLHARIDTGAKTSSLHVDDIQFFKKAGKQWVKFLIHPEIHNVAHVVQKEAKVHKQAMIKSSNGTAQSRPVIVTAFQLGELCWDIELTLSDRSEMTYLMLLGRQAMAGRVLVDPGQEYILGCAGNPSTDEQSEDS